MKITIGQSEIESAVKTYILSIMTLAEGANIDVDFSATRGPDGLTANINVLPREVIEKSEEEVVAQAREPEKATGSAADTSKPITRKTKTLVVEQKAPETASAAPEEEVATVAQTEPTEAVVEQQAESGDADQVEAVAVGGKGFPGFESEAELAETAAEPVAAAAPSGARKALFGGLGRPVNQ